MRSQGFSRNAQQGVALLVTLIILVVVTFLGLVAMRSGMLQVAMSTNSQVNAVVFQNADAGTTGVYNLVTATDPTTDTTNPINQVSNSPASEWVSCMTSTGLAASTIATPARCTASSSVSGRGAVLVQAALRVPTDASGGQRRMTTYGTDASALPGGGTVVLAAYSTAVMASYGSATSTQITDCLTNPQDGATTTVTSCLNGANASFQTVVQEFSYGYPGYR